MASEFVVFNEKTKQFGVAEPAVKLLRSLSGPICVLALCGRARQGKSFLLNQLLAKLQDTGQAPAATKKFTVGNTYKPCTKGLWLWSRPIPRTLPNGQPYHLLLLDAEGIDAYDQTADYSNHIFSLALLLSSLLVYNQMGSIDESAVEKLASVCEFARLIAGRADGAASTSTSSSVELARNMSSPAFVWLLRDFHLQLMEDGRHLTVREYMEQVLQDQPGASGAVRAKNQVRAGIKSLFPDRDCAALVRPMHDEAKLARMDSLPASELRPEFNQGLDALTKLLLTRCSPKALRGTVLTGPALVALAQAYVEVINKGRLPSIATTWQGVVQSECGRALDAASDLYRSRLEAARGPEVGMEQLEQVHTEALKEAEAAFGQQALGEPGEREPYLRRLRDTAAAALGPLRDTKRAQAEARSAEMLAGAARRFMESMRDERADLAVVEAQLHAFLREYAAARPLGGNTYMKAAEFLAGVVLPELRVRVTATRASAASAVARVTEVEGKLAEMTRRADAQRASLNTAELTEQQLRRELASVRTEVADAKARLAAAVTKAEGKCHELAALRQELAAMKAEATDAKARLAATGMTAEGSVRELAILKQQLAAARAEAADANARLAAASSTVEGRARELVALKHQLAVLRTEATDANARLAASSSTAGESARELGSLRQQLATLNAQKQHVEVELARLRSELAQERVQRTTAEAAVAQGAAAAAQVEGAQAVVAAMEAELVRSRHEVTTLRAAEAQFRQEMADLNSRHTVAATTVSTLQHERIMLQTRLDEQARKLEEQAKQVSDQERRLRAVADAAAAAAGPRVRSGPQAAAAAGAGGKRGREAAGLAKDRVELEEEEEDDDVVVVEDGPAGAGAAAGGSAAERAPRTDRRRVVANTEKRRRGSGVAGAGTAGTGGPGLGVLPATPEAGAIGAAAAAGGGAGGGGGAADGRAGQQRTPFSIERLVPLRSPPGGGLVRATPPAAGAGGLAATAIVATGTATSAGIQPSRNLDSMKVNEIKSWLTSQGWEADVFELSRHAPTKQDWLALTRRKIAASGEQPANTQQQG